MAAKRQGINNEGTDLDQNLREFFFRQPQPSETKSLNVGESAIYTRANKRVTGDRGKAQQTGRKKANAELCGGAGDKRV